MDQHLLDELEDARAKHQGWIRTRNWLLAGIAVGLVLLIGGPIALSILYALHVNLGPGSTWIPVVGALVAGGSGIGPYAAWSERYEAPAEVLRQAERAYRNAIMKEGQ